MSDFEEEIYSTMFTSLKHSIRRKILRMLSKKPRNFSEILKNLGISSSHLTYHLENLGELVSKIDDGRYKLSAFGKAAVGTMGMVEEAPKVERFLSLPIKWKSFFVVLTIGFVVIAGVNYTQYRSLNTLSVEFEQLSMEYEKLSAENGKLKELNVFLESKYEETVKGLLYYLESNVTFTGDVSGTGRVEFKGYFLDISSNVSVNDVELTFNSTFGDFAGTHIGYLHMERSSRVDPTIEIFYTYGPENDLWYFLHGFGTFEVSNRIGWFRINTTGYEFTLNKGGTATEWEWVLVWTGFPSFTVEANDPTIKK